MTKNEAPSICLPRDNATGHIQPAKDPKTKFTTPWGSCHRGVGGNLRGVGLEVLLGGGANQQFWGRQKR